MSEDTIIMFINSGRTNCNGVN